jgi:aminopeptidase
MTNKLIKGAKTAINKCLEVTSADRVLIITDEDTKEVGEALRAEAEKNTKNVLYLIIEDFIKRPATKLPNALVSQIKEFKPTVTIYAAQGQQGELPVFRVPLIGLCTKELNCRHAHMISITKELMEDGLNKDYDLVYKVSNNLANLLKETNKIHVTDKHGTDITFDLDVKDRKWSVFSGPITAGEMRNLPGGEVFTCPISANGTFVSWVLGDFLSGKYGELTTPLTVIIKDGYVTETACENSDIKKDFDDYIQTHKYGNRIGELGIGTLVGLQKFVGNLLQDEKFPGVHIAFGGSYPHETGADWDCDSHIDIIAKDVSISLTTENKELEVMKKGVYQNFILD